MEPSEAARRLARGLKAPCYEVAASVVRSTTLTTERSSIRSAEAAEQLVLEVRVADGGRVGYARSSGVREEAVVRNALEALRLSDVDERHPGAAGPAPLPSPEGVYDPRVAELLPEDMADRLRALMDAAADERVGVEVAAMGAHVTRSALASSAGLEAEESATLLSATLMVESGGLNVWDSLGSRGADLDVEGLGRSVRDLALASAGPRRIPSGRYDAVLGHHTVAELLSCLLAPAVNADVVLRGGSPLSGRVGGEVASEALGLTDDALLRGGLLSQSFDSEGTPSQATPLLRKGVLEGFLHDRSTAARAGVRSTGNCATLAARPSVEPTNLVVSAGRLPLEGLMGELGDGLHVVLPMGGFTSNPSSGDFSIQVLAGFLVEGGEVSHPVRDVVLSGNLYDVLRRVEAAGSDVRQVSHVVTPSLLVRGLSVVG